VARILKAFIGCNGSIKDDYESAITEFLPLLEAQNVPTPLSTTEPPTTTTTTTTEPPPPPTTTTTQGLVFPPTNLSEAKVLAATGNPADLSEFSSSSNDLPPCPGVGFKVVVTPGLTSEQLAADLLAFYFNANSGCGNFTINAYNQQSDADANSSTGGAQTAGGLMTLVSGKQHQVFVEIGGVLDQVLQFNFTYS
jgi:hypothetical protein